MIFIKQYKLCLDYILYNKIELKFLIVFIDISYYLSFEFGNS
jgi:hypothetical protein